MKPESIQRIRDSFTLITPQADRLMDEFYARLFAAYPQVVSMFPADMSQQKKHLLGAIGLVVKNADRLHTLEGPLMEMGARHLKYGAQPEHYPIVRDTLLRAMKAIAGPAWNAQLHDDWSQAINAVAAVMIRGAEAAQRKAA